MQKRNSEIRQKMKDLHVFQWQVADVLSVSEGWVTRCLRRELKGEQKEMIMGAISRANVKFNENV